MKKGATGGVHLRGLAALITDGLFPKSLVDNRSPRSRRVKCPDMELKQKMAPVAVGGVNWSLAR